MTGCPLALKVPLVIFKAPPTESALVSVMVPAAGFTVKLKKAEFEFTLEIPAKVTVPVPGVKVPPVLLQPPPTLKFPEGAVSVPPVWVTPVPVTEMALVLPVKVPELMVSPPLRASVVVLEA